MQVGLGTNSTFIQNLGGLQRDWCATIDWLLETVSEGNPARVNGVGVEPVAEHAEAMRSIASRRLPNVALLQLALGEADWPYVIQFETMGHCDRLEGTDAEWAAITELLRSGYTLLAYSHYNTQLVRNQALGSPRIDRWAGKLQCWGCNKRKSYPYIFAPGREGYAVYCRRCLKMPAWPQRAGELMRFTGRRSKTSRTKSACHVLMHLTLCMYMHRSTL